ncbi:MAG: glycerophosphoryl diester phosphodiesterase membrane domain-containing protein [Candidatus Kariarchaeaceae archaeon]|jgi:MFS family permease
MSKIDVIKEGNEIWKKSRNTEIKAIMLFAAISLIALIPAIILTYVGYNEEIDTILFIGILITAYFVFLHISYVLGIIYQIDLNTEKEEMRPITSIIRSVGRKIIPLAIISLFFAVIILIPLYIIDVFLFENYMNDIILQIMLVSLNYILLIILGVPWFFSVANIIIEDRTGLESFKISWKRFNNEFSTILPISIIAIFPVVVYTGVVSLVTYFIAENYDFELPQGFALLGWSISFIVASAIFLIMILPWSLDVTFPMYRMRKSET